MKINLEFSKIKYLGKYLGQIFRDEDSGEWRILHNHELEKLYQSPSIVQMIRARRLRWAGHVARMGEDTTVHRVMMGKPVGIRPLGRPKRHWEDNVKTDLKKVLEKEYNSWTELAQDRDRWRDAVHSVMNFRVPTTT